MAEPWTLAFGRYLRTLRERRGLSLHDVSSLSQAFAETIHKGYLSRCENGKQRLALSKVVPLSRIYEISADVLLERIDLDMELDRIGGPNTDGMTFTEMTAAGREAFNQGYRWKAYALLRDAVPHAVSDVTGPDYRDRDEQIASSKLSLGTAALGLGKPRLALHEYLQVKQDGHLGPGLWPLLYERLAVAYRNVGDLALARTCADQAIADASVDEGRRYLGYAYSTRAIQAYSDSDLDYAASLFQKAYRLYRENKQQHERAPTLANLGQVYFDLGRYKAARRALVAGERIADPTNQQRTRALSRILLGEIDVLEEREDLAEKRWKEATRIARMLNDKTLRFKAEYQLLRLAHKRSNGPVVRAIQRRLTRLSKYIPRNTPELSAFERLIAENKPVP